MANQPLPRWFPYSARQGTAGPSVEYPGGWLSERCAARAPEKKNTYRRFFCGSTLACVRADTQPRLRVLDWRRLRSRLPRSVLSRAGCPGEPVGERSSPKICEDPRLDTLSLRGRAPLAKRRWIPEAAIGTARGWSLAKNCIHSP